MVFSRRWITRACVILSNGYSQLSTAFGTICAGSFPSGGQIVLGDLKTPLLELFELLKLLGPLGPLWCCCCASLDEGVACVTVELDDAELVEGLSAAEVPEVEAWLLVEAWDLLCANLLDNSPKLVVLELDASSKIKRTSINKRRITFYLLRCLHELSFDYKFIEWKRLQLSRFYICCRGIYMALSKTVEKLNKFINIFEFCNI